MSLLNRPDKITLDAYSDTNLDTANPNGVYNRFTNVLKTPILNAKGLQLLNANFINSILQLNDNGHLMFFYYASTTQANIRILENLYCVRLHPSTFVPYTGYTAFVKNKYYNSVVELVSDLNFAAATGGDDVIYNPIWVADQVQFVFDTLTRKISLQSAAGLFVAPAAADDPFVLDHLRGTTYPNLRIRMNSFNSGNTYATSFLQPYVENISMNARIGFGMGFNTRGIWFGPSSQIGCATNTGVPLAATLIEADANPILLGSQTCRIYLSVVQGGGIDSTGRKNLIETVPIEVAPLNISSFSTPLEIPTLSVPNEIYEITAEMLDDNGQPFLQPPNFNTTLALAVYY